MGSDAFELWDDDPLIGRVLNDRYKVVELIGRGGMGSIYKAEQSALQRMVAVKVILPELTSQPELDFRRRFFQEASLTAKLRHPNTVTVLDYGQTEDGVFFLVMELIEGVTLAEVLKRRGALPWTRAVDIATQIARSLHEAHRQGVVHRDLKPANIMLLADADHDLVKVLDFGLVKSVLTEPEGTPKGTERAGESSLALDPEITQAGKILGSPRYMAPEQARGHADARTDLYSLGVILYEMLVGQPPFAGESTIELLFKHLSEEPRRLSSVRPDLGIPTAIEQVVERCLAKDPEKRLQSMEAVIAALRQASATTSLPPALVQPPAVAEPESTELASEDSPTSVFDIEVEEPALLREAGAPERSARRRWPLMLGVTVLAVGAGAAGVIFVQEDRAPVVPVVTARELLSPTPVPEPPAPSPAPVVAAVPTPTQAIPSPGPGTSGDEAAPKPSPEPDLPESAPSNGQAASAAIAAQTPSASGGDAPSAEPAKKPRAGKAGKRTALLAPPPPPTFAGPFPQPPGTVPVNFVVDDSANRVFKYGDLQWKSTLSVDPATRLATKDEGWGGPFPTLYDDGPWTAGGHEPAGAIAGDHRWGITVFVQPGPTVLSFEYGLVDASIPVRLSSADPSSVGWLWTGSNGVFRVPPGATAPINAFGVAFERFGQVDVRLTLDINALAKGKWDPTRVALKSGAWSWFELDLKDDGEGDDEVAGDGVFTFQLSRHAGAGRRLPHSGLLNSGDRFEFMFLVGRREYKLGGTPALEGVAAAVKGPGGGWTPVRTVVAPATPPPTLNPGNRNTMFVVP